MCYSYSRLLHTAAATGYGSFLLLLLPNAHSNNEIVVMCRRSVEQRTTATTNLSIIRLPSSLPPLHSWRSDCHPLVNMPSLPSQTLTQRLKQQRERLQQLLKQQTSGSSSTAVQADRSKKQQRPQPTDESEQQQEPRRQPENDDSGNQSKHKKQKQKQIHSAEAAQPRAAPAQRGHPRTLAKLAPASTQPKPRTRPTRHANRPTSIQHAASTDNEDTQQEEQVDDDTDHKRTNASTTPHTTPESTKRIKNPQVYLDLAINQQPIGRLVLELFQYASPRTVANFRALCTGERGVGSSGHALHYLNSRVHRIDPSFAIQLGDITDGDGTGGDSIYGAPTFPHEPSHRRHTGFGTVSTSAALHSTDGASSTFFISTSHSPLRWLDKRHTVFGRVVRGKQVLLDIERLAGRRKGGTPKAEVTISGCGSMRKEQKEEEDNKRRQRHEAQAAKVKGKVELLCPRCESVGRVNKKTKKGVRVWCTDEECQYCWYEALSEWDEVKKAEFVVKETKRREEEEQKERDEEEAREGMDGEEEGEDEGEDEDGEMDEHGEDDVSGGDEEEEDD